MLGEDDLSDFTATFILSQCGPLGGSKYGGYSLIWSRDGR